MTRSQQQAIAQARLEQIKRVNSASVPALEVYRGENAESERLRLLLKEARQELENCRELLGNLQEQVEMLTRGGNGYDSTHWKYIDGRRVVTPEEAARMQGVSVSTINRSLADGTIEGKQKPGKKGRWDVFADSIKRRTRKKRINKKKGG